jgi:CSLREA domain-containing protein
MKHSPTLLLSCLVALTTFATPILATPAEDPLALRICEGAAPPILVVNTTDDIDDGACNAAHCSLREAIHQANDHAGPDTIWFTIPAADPGCDPGGVCTIAPTGNAFSLYDDGTTVDGYTQHGAVPNTNPVGQPINAVLRIVLNGSLLPECCPYGIHLWGSGSVIRGLVIQGFHGGIDIIDASSNRIEGNFIGTDVHGLVALGNRTAGVLLTYASEGPGSSNNYIGGSHPRTRNLISGNGRSGVGIGRGAANRLQGNYIGTDASGTTPLPNGESGLHVWGESGGHLIGGAASGEANIIAFNGTQGVLIDGRYGNTIHNTIRRDSIHSNVGKGIWLWEGGNEGLPAPVIHYASANMVTGTACPNCTVEVFSDSQDEGAIYEGSVGANATGEWSFLDADGLKGPNITATATDNSGNTSEFSQPFAMTGATPTATPTSTATLPQPTYTPTLGPPTSTATLPQPTYTPTLGPPTHTATAPPTTPPIPTATRGATPRAWRVMLPLVVRNLGIWPAGLPHPAASAQILRATQ